MKSLHSDVTPTFTFQNYIPNPSHPRRFPANQQQQNMCGGAIIADFFPFYSQQQLHQPTASSDALTNIVEEELAARQESGEEEGAEEPVQGDPAAAMGEVGGRDRGPACGQWRRCRL